MPKFRMFTIKYKGVNWNSFESPSNWKKGKYMKTHSCIFKQEGLIFFANHLQYVSNINGNVFLTAYNLSSVD